MSTTNSDDKGIRIWLMILTVSLIPVGVHGTKHVIRP